MNIEPPQYGGTLERPNFVLLVPTLAMLVIILFVGFTAEIDVLYTLSLSLLEVLPFVLLAMISYLGLRYTVARVLAWTMLVLFNGTAIFVLGAITAFFLTSTQQKPGLMLGIRCLIAGFTVLGGLVLSIAAVTRPFQVWCSRYIPITPGHSVQGVALSLQFALIPIAFAPLLVLGRPLIYVINDYLISNNNSTVFSTAETVDASAQLDLLCRMFWVSATSLFIVGFGTQRTLRESFVRLGLVLPRWKHLYLAFILPLLLVVIVTGFDSVQSWIWEKLHWARTDDELRKLSIFQTYTPLGVLVFGLVAGFSEEIAIRGILQPRVGILLSNLFFTSLHAFQYHWDYLIVVFLLGIVFGYLRRWTNTTTAALVHSAYDCLIIMLAIYRLQS